MRFCIAVILLTWFTTVYGGRKSSGNTADAKTIYIAGFLGNTDAAKNAVELAIEDITDAEVLGNYKLEVVWNQTNCDMATATKQLFDALHYGPTKLLLLCCACPSLTGPIAEIAGAWHMTQVSYADTSALLSDKHKYANFFRLVPSEVDFNPARLRLLEEFSWRKVGVISLDPSSGNQRYAMTYNKLIKLLEDQNFTMKAETIVNEFNRIKTVMEQFKNDDYRIFIGLFDENSAQKVFCAAHKYGLYGEKYAWIVASSWEWGWWRLARKSKLSASFPCTEADLLRAINGYLTTSIQLVAPSTTGSSRPAEYLNRYRTRVGNSSHDPYHAYAYDTVWTISLALSRMISNLSLIGKPAPLITQRIRNDSLLINRTLNSLDFPGVTGRVQFAQGERIGTIDYFQFQGNRLTKVGEYVAARHELVASDSGKFFWHGRGSCPKADVVRTIEAQYISLPIFVVISIIASIGVVFAIFLICINIIFRNHRFIKMSSPNMNNLIILGSMMSYISVILLGLDGRFVTNDVLVQICTARNCVLTTGFTLAFGAMFTKTWRVHAIFTNITMNKRVMRDYQLVGAVFALLLVDVVILSLWAAIDPLMATQRELGRLTTYRDNKEYLITPVIKYCESEKMNIWMSLIYLYKGCLLIIGCFFAWETRHVSIPALNDSRYIGMSVYNVVIMCASGAAISFIVDSSYFNALFVIMSTFIIFSTSITLCFIFIPKLIELRKDPKGQEKRVRATLVKSKKEVNQDNFEAKLKKTIDDNFVLKKMLDQKLSELTQLTNWCNDPEYQPSDEQRQYLLQQPSSTSPTTTTEIGDEASQSQSQSQSIAPGVTTASRVETEMPMAKDKRSGLQDSEPVLKECYENEHKKKSRLSAERSPKSKSRHASRDTLLERIRNGTDNADAVDIEDDHDERPLCASNDKLSKPPGSLLKIKSDVKRGHSFEEKIRLGVPQTNALASNTKDRKAEKRAVKSRATNETRLGDLGEPAGMSHVGRKLRNLTPNANVNADTDVIDAVL